MKFTKRALAVCLAAATALSVTACSGGEGGEGGEGGGVAVTTTTTVGSFTEATAPQIDETAETGTIKWLMYEDLLTNNADMVALFESRYGGSIEQEITNSGSGYFERLGVLIAGGDSPDIVRYEWQSFPHGMSYNMYTPLDSYIDADSDLWKGMKEIAEQFAYNGKHYYYPYQLKTNFCLNYNNRVLEENGITDPMTLLEKDEWTWSAFEDMLKQWCNIDPVNHIGYNGVGGMIFVLTTGTKVIDIQNGEIINNLKNENVTRCMQWLEGMRKEGLLGASVDQQAAGAVSGYVSPEAAFVDGNLLFLGMDPSWTYPTAKQTLDTQGLSNEMKFVPFPRDDLSDTYYHGVDTFGYMIPSGAKNVKGAVDWINLNREEEVDPENIASAREDALDDSVAYYPKCANSDCGDTSENADDKGRHIFTDEENEAGVTVCPVCGTARKEKYKVVWTEEQYDLYMELRSTENSRFTLLFDNCYGFNSDVSKVFQSSDEPLLDGPVFGDFSYTSLVDKYYSVVEGYIQPYRDRMAADARGETIETTAPEETAE